VPIKSAAELLKQLGQGSELLTQVRLRVERERETRSLPDAEPAPVSVDVERATLRPQDAR
jgi:hypothetical protein